MGELKRLEKTLGPICLLAENDIREAHTLLGARHTNRRHRPPLVDRGVGTDPFSFLVLVRFYDLC
jgi:hypothetical protein